MMFTNTGNKKMILLLSLAMLLVFTAGCGNSGRNHSANDAELHNHAPASQDGFTITATDSLGRKVTIESEPGRIISLSPAITEILFAIGVADRIVGVTDYCDYPAEAKQKPKIGGFETPNLELIVDSEPNVIFTAAGIQEDFIKQFEQLGIKVVVLDAQNIDQVMNNIRLAGQVTGSTTKSTEIVEDIQRRLAIVKENIAGAKTKPTVFVEIWDDPLMTAGPGSFINDLINLAGGINIAENTNEEFVEYNREMLLAKDPEIYIINSHDHTPEDIKNRPGYAGLRAVRENRVYSIEDDLLTLPGPRLIEGLETLARIIHPDLQWTS